MNKVKTILMGVSLGSLLTATQPTYALFDGVKNTIKNSTATLKNKVTNNTINKTNQPALDQAKEKLKQADTTAKTSVPLTPNSVTNSQIIKKNKLDELKNKTLNSLK